MKISFSTLGCPTWSWEQILHFAEEQAFDGIEIRGIQENLSAGSVDTVLTEQEGFTKAFLQKTFIKLVCLDTSIALHDRTNWPKSMKEFTQSLQTCASFQIPAIRVFGNKIEGTEPRKVINRVIDGLHELCALSQGPSVLLENHGDFSTIETLAPIVSEMQEPNFGIIWDVEHSDTVYGDAYGRFYDVIASKIKHVHIKDQHRNNGLCLVGEGDIPLTKIIRQLTGDGYDGYYSLEWEKRWKPELEEPQIAIASYARWMRSVQV
jgi:sugar phosphate isomerase/epimerase